MSFFMPKTNGYFLLARTHSFVRYLCTITAICLLVYCWYYFIHLPINTLIVTQRNQTNDLATKKLLIRNYKSFDLAQAQQMHQQLKNDFEQLIIKKTVKDDDLFMHIVESARCADLLIGSCTSNIGQHKTINKDVTVVINTTGSYKQLMHFFKTIYSKNNIRCSSLQLKNSGQNEYSFNGEFKLVS